MNSGDRMEKVGGQDGEGRGQDGEGRGKVAATRVLVGCGEWSQDAV